MDSLPLQEFAFGDVPDAGQGLPALDRPLSVLKQATLLLERNFHPFVELPEEQRMALNNILQVVLSDEELLVALEQVCEDVVNGLSPPPAILEKLKPPQQQDLMAFLCLVGYRVQGGHPGPEDAVSNQKLFSTAYFLVSALAEMPANTVALLGACCKLQIIPMLCHLLRALADGVSDLENPDLAPLKDTERFTIVQHLFASVDMNLEREQSSVKVVTQKDPNIISPLILYISLNGFCALGRAH